MSDQASQKPKPAELRADHAGERRGSLRQRLPLYGAGLLLAVVILAYVDGGEESIRPIVQEVTPSLISGSGQ